jgi:hypothetical protein
MSAGRSHEQHQPPRHSPRIRPVAGSRLSCRPPPLRGSTAFPGLRARCSRSETFAGKRLAGTPGSRRAVTFPTEATIVLDTGTPRAAPPGPPRGPIRRARRPCSLLPHAGGRRPANGLRGDDRPRSLNEAREPEGTRTVSLRCRMRCGRGALAAYDRVLWHLDRPLPETDPYATGRAASISSWGRFARRA